MLVSLVKRIAEENHFVLTQRWREANDVERSLRADTDAKMIETLRQMDQAAVERAADCAWPIFGVALEVQALRNLLEYAPSRRQPRKEAPSYYLCSEDDKPVMEAECVLLNRWSIALAENTAARVATGMSEPLSALLATLTVQQVKSMARLGRPIVGFRVGHAYFAHCLKAPNLSRAQRSDLLSANVLSSGAHVRPVAAVR